MKDKDDSSVVKQALIISQDLGQKFNNSYHSKLLDLLKFCNSRKLGQPHKLRPEHLPEMISHVKKNYSEFWKQKIESSPKLDFYKKIKKDFSSEFYLDMVQNFEGLSRKQYVKFRTSNHTLLVESKRYCKPQIPREDRICEFCNLNEVEDEIHVLFNCTLYTSYRNVFFNKLDSTFKTDNKENFIASIFRSKSEPALFYLINYINKCLEKRKSLPLR